LAEVQSQLAKIHDSRKPNIKHALKIFANRAFTYESFKVLNTTLSRESLPTTLVNFEQLQKIHFANSRVILHAQLREFLINEMQDTMRRVFQ